MIGAGDTVLMGPRVQEPAVSDGEIENKKQADTRVELFQNLQVPGRLWTRCSDGGWLRGGEKVFPPGWSGGTSLEVSPLSQGLEDKR